MNKYIYMNKKQIDISKENATETNENVKLNKIALCETLKWIAWQTNKRSFCFYFFLKWMQSLRISAGIAS